jgi:hypothetical protein
VIDFEIDPHGRSIWWKQLDDGLYLPDFLEYRWGKDFAEWESLKEKLILNQAEPAAA